MIYKELTFNSKFLMADYSFTNKITQALATINLIPDIIA